MSETDISMLPLLARAAAYLRDAHLARGVGYLGLAAGTMQAFATWFPRAGRFDIERIHVAVLPLTLAVTRAFAQLRPEDRAEWEGVDLGAGAREAIQGAGLGAAALLTTLGMAYARGWLSAPQWGTASGASGEVGRTMAILAGSHLAVAWNEELVFRGYGYTTLKRAMPEPVAGSLITALFALAHPINPRTLADEAALGFALLALRVHTGGVWMPIGYHWAWNVLQTAVFGPADGPPSLRPLALHGPPEWLGRPGHTDGGLLSTLTSLAVGVGVLLHRSSRRRGGRTV